MSDDPIFCIYILAKITVKSDALYRTILIKFRITYYINDTSSIKKPPFLRTAVLYCKNLPV